MTAPLPENEAARLETLLKCKLLDTAPESAFDDITRLAAQICGTPIALVSLIDADRQWFKSNVGLEARETPRAIAFCAHTILQTDVLIVPDALKDKRFATNPLVTSKPYIRFYAGVPLITPEGHTLGSLCVIDYLPRQLEPQQLEALQRLGRQVVKLIELHRNSGNLELDAVERKQAKKQRQRFFRRIAAGFGITSAILVIIGAVSYRSLTGMIATFSAATHSQEVLETLEEVLSQIKDVETGQRGYVITGEESYLNNTAIEEVVQEIKNLRQLTTVNPNQQRQIDILEQLIAEKIAISKQIIELRKHKGFEAAKQLVSTGKGKSLMDAIRSNVQEMETQENKLLTQQLLWAEASARNTIFTFSSGIFLTFFILAGVYYCIYREISERKRTEAVLQQEQNFTAAVLDTANALVVVLDMQGRIVRFNRACEQTTGYTFAEVKSKYFWELFLLPAEVESVKAIFTNLQAGQFSNQYENYWLTRQGDRRLIAWSNTILRDPFVAVEYIICTGIDITERQRAEQELRESEERYRDLFENASDMILSIAPDGRFLYVNRAWRETLGYSEAEIFGLSVFDTIHPDSRVHCQALFQQVIRGENIEEIAAAFISKDNHKIEVEGSLNSRLVDGKPVFCRAIFRDVTERKKHELELQKANERLVGWVKELEQRNREIALLGEIGDVMQACLTIEEAYMALAQLIPSLFPQTSGGIFVIDASKNLVQAVAIWGSPQFNGSSVFTPHDCWALRRGRVHRVENTHGSLLCHHHLNYTPPAASLCVPMMAQSEAMGVLNLNSQDLGGLSETKQQLAVTVAEHIALALANLKLREKLQHQSIRDPLTGLFNRRYMEESLERELYRAERQQQSLGIIMLDVDHFKRFNDTFGHEAGDLVLRELGMFLQKHIRKSDIACRYGGEELMLILPEASLDVTYQRAEQLRQGIKHLQMQHQNQTLSTLTLSSGVAVFPEHGTKAETLLRAADVALYRAKQQGRDRVVIADNSQSGISAPHLPQSSGYNISGEIGINKSADDGIRITFLGENSLKTL